MARLSGLASEHHPEGPGDAPKRRRGKNTKATASQSSPVEAAGSSKRAASPTVQPTKRAKRVQVDDHDQLARELEESTTRSQASAKDDAVSRRGRRFSEPVVTAHDDIDGNSQLTPPPPATQPLPGLTPHLQRLSAAPRRGRPTKARMSLPAHLEAAEEHENIVQFAPLTAIVNGRAQRRIRRNHLSEEINDIEDHNKQDARRKKEVAELHQQLDSYYSRVKELEFQLEASRLGNMAMAEDDTEELQAELAETRKSMAELKASSVFAGSDDDSFENDSQVMVDPDDLGIPEEDMEVEPLPNGFFGNQALEMSTQYTSQYTSQVTLETLDEMDETVLDNLADATQTSSAVERYELEIKRLGRKLQNLNVSPLRHLLQDARDETESIIPNSTTGHDNGQLIRKILQLLRGSMVELREKAHLLRTQNDGLLDKLVDADEEKRDLQAKWHEIDRMLDDEKRNVDELQERLAGMHQDAEILGLKDELEDEKTGAERLRDALEGYKKEMEAAHIKEIAELKEAHEEEVHRLQTDLDAETEARQQAEDEAQQKEEYIDQIEETIQQISTLREPAETDRNSQTALAVADLEEQLGNFRQNLEAERTQREATEADLEQANADLEDVNSRLHDLFALNEDAAAREDELQDQLADETKLRKDAEAELEQDLMATEDQLTSLTATHEDLITDRDSKVKELNRQIEDVRMRYSALETTSQTTINSLHQLTERALKLERDAVVADVQHIAALEQEKESLQKENASLAQRVDSEAMELLNIVGNHAQESARLEATIDAQAKYIAGLEDQAEQRRVQYEEEIAQKREELEDAQVIGATRAEHVANLAGQLEAMEKKYETDMAASQDTIETLQEGHRVLILQNEQYVLINRKRQEEGTMAMKEMKAQGLRFNNKAVDLSKVTKGKVTKVTEKQRITKKTAGRKKEFSRNFKDSGFVEDITAQDEEEEYVERVVEGVVG
ncbi:hypothetical protein P154DRAFT_554313 [Amniculicola lignicola CBS 123094]|uniref:Uncharacterized protein n=1 Tax=Amniculicola lignicola CBS 123094 TaxID=1392246 RepID=A0A6A5WGI3_9PLEO|nr:hypothetical protein P154DRAFT_554313 [Amniculicola lignicola CBS 123094]